ncbi:MAG: glycosyltransferase family 2 protein [Dehalococcoidia bacterium]|nr:glycosyltransferase family 2 protein [Dehalococcoidia bacterium]
MARTRALYQWPSVATQAPTEFAEGLPRPLPEEAVRHPRVHSERPKIVAAIPCYNEEAFIGDIVQQARRYVDEVIVVDDGSHDGTAVAARAAGAIVLKHEMNKGYGEAIGSCFKAARDVDADILVTLDGDSQHAASEIPAVVEPVVRGEADLAIGSRFMSPDHQRHMPGYRKLGIEIITWLLNVGSDTKVSDSQSGFRAYSRRLVDALPVTQKGMGVSVEVIARARRARFAIREVPITCIYHRESSTMNPLTHGMSVVLATLRCRSMF